MQDNFLALFEQLFPDIRILSDTKALANRRYDFDFFLPDYDTAIELIKPELFVLHFETRLKEINLAQSENIRVYQFTEKLINEDYLLKTIKI